MSTPFIANIIFSISCDGVFTDQYEEQLRIVFASDIEEAIKSAKEMAAVEEGNFVDRKGRMMCWKFLAIKDVMKVSLEQGSLLHSSIKEVEPVGFIY